MELRVTISIRTARHHAHRMIRVIPRRAPPYIGSFENSGYFDRLPSVDGSMKEANEEAFEGIRWDWESRDWIGNTRSGANHTRDVNRRFIRSNRRFRIESWGVVVKNPRAPVEGVESNQPGKAQAAVTPLSHLIYHTWQSNPRAFALSRAVRSRIDRSNRRICPESVHTTTPGTRPRVEFVASWRSRDRIFWRRASRRHDQETRNAPGATTSRLIRCDVRYVAVANESKATERRAMSGGWATGLTARDKNLGRTCDSRIYVRLAESQSCSPS